MSDNSQKCPAQVPLAQIGILNVLFCLYNSPKSKCIQFTTIKNNKNIFKLLIFFKKSDLIRAKRRKIQERSYMIPVPVISLSEKLVFSHQQK